MSFSLLLALGPEIKVFIGVMAIAGPIAIAGLIFLLKKIEKEDPSKIRWR